MLTQFLKHEDDRSGCSAATTCARGRSGTRTCRGTCRGLSPPHHSIQGCPEGGRSLETHVSRTSRAPRISSYTFACIHRNPNLATLAGASPPRVPTGPAGSPLIPAMPFKARPKTGSCRSLAGGGCWGARAWGQRVAGPYLQGSPWPAAGRSACPPGAMPAPSIPSPAPHGTLLQRPPPAATGWC